jgi:acetyl-CoA carboxylase biotin carboxyl carrier protein
MVPAPIVGTFYEASSPGSPAFVQVGDHVEPGQVLCIIEAMKLMNEIEAETGGIVVKRFVQNAQPVEYGEALFAIGARAGAWRDRRASVGSGARCSRVSSPARH